MSSNIPVERRSRVPSLLEIWKQRKGNYSLLAHDNSYNNSYIVAECSIILALQSTFPADPLRARASCTCPCPCIIQDSTITVFLLWARLTYGLWTLQWHDILFKQSSQSYERFVSELIITPDDFFCGRSRKIRRGNITVYWNIQMRSNFGTEDTCLLFITT